MAKITRPTKEVVAFGSGALTNERTVFGDETTESDDLTINLNDDYIRGWAAGIDSVSGYPPMEFFSGQMFTTSQLVAYLFQMGVPEWDTNQYYPENALSMGSDGTLWQSLQGHSGVSQVSGSYWRTHSFPSGTVMVFSQASAPTGWTKKSDWADNASLIVGNTYGSGGSDSPLSWTTAVVVGAHATHRHLGAAHIHGMAHTHSLSGTSQTRTDGESNYRINSLTTGSASASVTGSGGAEYSEYGGPTEHSVTQDTYTPKYQILIAATKD